MKSGGRSQIVTFALCVVFLPLDLLRFTKDILRMALGRHYYRKVRGYPEQPCVFCMGEDTGRSPRPLPCGLRVYRNRWLILPWLPCVRKIRVPSRDGLVKAPGCSTEGGYVRLGAEVIWCAVFVVVFWVGLILYLLIHL